MNQLTRSFTKNKLLIFAILFSGLLLISAANAEELNSTDNSTQTLMEVSNDDILQGNSFDDLSNRINETPQDQTLTLDKDYYLTSPSGNHIVIEKSMTIDGTNHIIQASDLKRVFWIKADNVCIKNINFINTNSNLAGGVISWWGNNGTLENCNFTGNTAISGGGALLWKGDNGVIENCNFENNVVKYGADVSLTSGDGFDKTKLHIQTVNSDGGAIYISGNNISINYCSFSNNLAYLSGGAVSVNWGDNVSVSNSRFKNNKADYGGGAIDWNSRDALIVNSTFEGNSPKNLFLNANAVIINSTFDKKDSIESWYDVIYVNVTYSDIGSFEELFIKINNTPERGILVLDKDYEYINGTNKGVLISKSITIDGAGHTLNGNKLSRMFNVTADNVTIRNLNFINGNAYGRYFAIAGGGAIYWYGANGYLENCNFTDNAGSGIEDDPFDREEKIINDDGSIIYVYRVRPMGAKVNEGGAIVWNGTDGVVKDCIFTNNAVGYPNTGGAICWRGDNGRIISSQFYENDAWCGSAIAWVGNNGTILSSIIANSSFFDGGIYWFGKNGTIANSVLTSIYSRASLRGSEDVISDYNFWGDTLENPNGILKGGNISNWLVMKFTHNGEFVNKGDKLVIKSDITTLVDKNRNMSYYDGLINYSSKIVYTAPKTGFLTITFKNGEISIEVDEREHIVSFDKKVFYQKKTSFKVKVYDVAGKVVSKKVKFTINKKTYYAKTDKNGIATLKLNLKPGKYTVHASYGKVKVKNTITVKNVLITKDINKKVKKSAKFTVKVLNSKGKAYAKQVVNVKFKGKTYKIKTDKKGIATFNVPKDLKIGKYTIKTTYNGLTNSNKIIVKK